MIDRLTGIVARTTRLCRKGEVVTETTTPSGMRVVSIDAMPLVAEFDDPATVLVDVHFAAVEVDKAEGEAARAELVEVLRAWPHPGMLESGPSYIVLGAAVGDQGLALCLMGLGKALGLWDVITPGSLGVTGEAADRMAGQGFVMTTGLRA